jgi:uncharacterized protein (DUF305 family)
MHRSHYLRFAAMLALSFASMYVLMYAMVDTWGSVFNNVNQIYMAGLMTAPMAIFELALMRSMFKDSRLNIIIAAAAMVALIGFFILIRAQTGVGDQQFLRSMIPHHSGAILMCERADIESQDIKELCASIIKGQAEEIDRMKNLLAAPSY